MPNAFSARFPQLRVDGTCSCVAGRMRRCVARPSAGGNGCEPVSTRHPQLRHGKLAWCTSRDQGWCTAQQPAANLSGDGRWVRCGRRRARCPPGRAVPVLRARSQSLYAGALSFCLTAQQCFSKNCGRADSSGNPYPFIFMAQSNTQRRE